MNMAAQILLGLLIFIAGHTGAAGLADGQDIPDFSKVINPAPLRQVSPEKVLQ